MRRLTYFLSALALAIPAHAELWYEDGVIIRANQQYEKINVQTPLTLTPDDTGKRLDLTLPFVSSTGLVYDESDNLVIENASQDFDVAIKVNDGGTSRLVFICDGDVSICGVGSDTADFFVGAFTAGEFVVTNPSGGANARIRAKSGASGTSQVIMGNALTEYMLLEVDSSGTAVARVDVAPDTMELDFTDNDSQTATEMVVIFPTIRIGSNSGPCLSADGGGIFLDDGVGGGTACNGVQDGTETWPGAGS